VSEENTTDNAISYRSPNGEVLFLLCGKIALEIFILARDWVGKFEVT
jgi:hypothetical protein